MKTYKPIYVSNYDTKEELMRYIKTHKIYAEPSACYDGYHIEILCDENEYKNIISFLDSII